MDVEIGLIFNFGQLLKITNFEMDLENYVLLIPIGVV